MPLKHLEHDGNEDFEELNVTNKKQANITDAIKEIINDDEREREEELARLQEEWMNPNNPALWDGEI